MRVAHLHKIRYFCSPQAVIYAGLNSKPMKMNDELKRILSHFPAVKGVTAIAPVNSGLINATYKVTAGGEKQQGYILQRINHHVFKDIDMLQHNIELVTAHIRKKLEQNGETDIDRKVLRFLQADTGKTYYYDGDGGYWRVSVYIPDSVTVDAVNERTSRLAGRKFGEFQAFLSDLPDRLGETIPNFHNMEFRLKQFQEAIGNNAAGRLEQVRGLADALLSDAGKMCAAERLYREGKLPKRICHCDTKVSNMLFDKAGNVLCVIDLDTVMPNFIFSDYGDFLRSAANTGAEDDRDLENVRFNMDIFRAFTSGYLESATFLTPVEKDLLPFAAELFPYMQAVRFFTDYLNGDTYYKTLYPEHNLVRTRAQLRLYQDVVRHEQEMGEFVDNCF